MQGRGECADEKAKDHELRPGLCTRVETCRGRGRNRSRWGSRRRIRGEQEQEQEQAGAGAAVID